MVAATKHLTEYIKTLCKNTFNNNYMDEPLLIDLIISGGAFNIGYGYGTILYLKELQDKKKIKINKVSGCSSGALLALLTLCDNKVDVDTSYIKIQKHFRKHGNLSNLKNVIKTIVNTCIKNDYDAMMLTGKLYITTTDMSNYTHKVISTYKNRKDIIDSIISSCYLPFLIDGNPRYNNKYIDGFFPYIFKNSKNRSLYINLINKQKLMKVLYNAGETNPHYRIIEGVIEAATFLNEGKSYMCSWVNDWSFIDFVIYRFMYLLILFICTIAETVYTFNIPIVITKSFIYKSITNTLSTMIKDYIYISCR
jgi:hypothetical protein